MSIDRETALEQLARRAWDAAMAPDVPPKMLPQLLGVATRAAAALPPGRPREQEPDRGDLLPGVALPELPPLPLLLPGPPWEPLRGLTEAQAAAYNDELIARRIVALREEAQRLVQALNRPDLIAQVERQLADARATASRGDTAGATLRGRQT